MDFSIIPKTKVIFCISGDGLNIFDVNKRMQIESAGFKRKKHPHTVESAMTEWRIETKKEYYRSISYHFEELIEVLKGKEETINAICEQYNATTVFIVNIFMELGGRPVMDLTKEIVSFTASINAEVDFKLHLYKFPERLFRIAEQLFKGRSYWEQCK